MANTCAYNNPFPATADGDEPSNAPFLLTLTGANAPPNIQSAYSLRRFATSFAPSGAGSVVDLYTIGGTRNQNQWQMITYTCTGTVLSAPQLLIYNSFAPFGASGDVTATILASSVGGLQGTYGNQGWIRFATNFAPANGNTVADLVMPGGYDNSSRW